MKELKKLEEKYEALGREIEALKNKKHPMSWDAFLADNSLCKAHMTEIERWDGFHFVWNKSPIKYESLRKLELLCKAWGGGYGNKYTIYNTSSGLMRGYTPSKTHLISFDKKENAELFLETFKDLFEEAKELL